MTRNSIILKKAEYLLDRKLTQREADAILKTVKVGNMAEVKKVVSKFNTAQEFTDVGEIVEAGKIRDASTKEELQSIIEDIAVKATSVNSGLKILKAADGKTKESLMTYIMNLYLRHTARKSRKMKTADGHGATLDSPASMTPNMQYKDPFVTPFHNPGQENNSTVQVQDEYLPSGYTRNELGTRPYHNEKKKHKKIKEQIKKYIDTNIGKPTGGKEDSDVIGKT